MICRSNNDSGLRASDASAIGHTANMGFNGSRFGDGDILARQSGKYRNRSLSSTSNGPFTLSHISRVMNRATKRYKQYRSDKCVYNL